MRRTTTRTPIVLCGLWLASVSALLSTTSTWLHGCLAFQQAGVMIPAFGVRSTIRRNGKHYQPHRLSSSRGAGEGLEGVGDFESWFSGVQGSNCNPYIKHTAFGNLRGLGTLDKNSITSSSGDSWMKIPRSITLQSDFSQKDWDAKLAQSLWREVLQGSSSPVSGYVSLLTKSWTTDSLPGAPPFAAPDALRHWSDDETSALAAHPEGKALLDLRDRQMQAWRQKFEALEGANTMEWEHFEWAMEAVHSRAFCGDFGVAGGESSLPMPVAIGAPLFAGLAGYVYYVQLHGQSDAILLSLAALGAIPSVLSLLKESPPVAVMLPLIDSANHLEEADSAIEYSPLTDSFDLTGGSKCLVTEADGKQQVYISYGKKSDKELLLNYGFLKGVAGSSEESVGDVDDESTRRKKLADQFVANQQS